MGITHKRQKWCFTGFGLSGKKFLWKERKLNKMFLWKESLPFTIYGLLVNLLCNSRYLGLLRCTMAVAA